MSMRRVGPLCGLLFTPLYAAFTFIPVLPEASYSDERVIALYTDPRNVTAITLGSVLMGFAGLALAVFLADMWQRLRTDAHGALATLAFGTGLIYIAMLFVAGTLWVGYAGGGAGPLETAPDVEHSVVLARVLTDMGFGILLIYGLLAASVMVLGTSIVGRRTGVLPRGVAVTGYVVAPLLLLGFAWVPQFLVPLWVLTVSISQLRTKTRTKAVPAPLTPSGQPTA